MMPCAQIRSVSSAFAAAVVLSLAAPAYSVNYEMVTVSDAGNAPDTTNYGAVPYEYQMGKYEVTIQQYTDFLNAVAKSNPYLLWDDNVDISRSGTMGDYSYAAVPPKGATPVGADSPGNRPIGGVDFYQAARFVNWMHNGQGSGDTETGAYTVSEGERSITAANRTNGVATFTYSGSSAYYPNSPPSQSTLSVGDQVSVWAGNLRGTYIVASLSAMQFSVVDPGPDLVASLDSNGWNGFVGVSAIRTSNAKFFIPTRDEWYKAAYYSPLLNSGSGGYYEYATQSNTSPGNTVGDDANQVNYLYNNVYSVTQSGSLSIQQQNYLTNVGAFTSSASHYGTFDQNGNVAEWNEFIAPNRYRGSAGGSFGTTGNTLGSTRRGITAFDPLSGGLYSGFRLAAPVAVPEPSTCAMALAGLACGGYSLFRRRRVR